MSDQLAGNNLVKVNLGSGFLGLPGWLNYDNSPVMMVARFPRLLRLGVHVGILSPKWLGVKWPPIIRHDCRKGIPLAADSVDCIFTSHFLEHLYRHQVLGVLKECFRVLKPGARIRVVVPDVRKAVEIYLAGKPDPECPCTPDEVLPFTMADWLSAQFGCADMNRVSKPRLPDKLVNLRRHRWMYDRESMSRLLEHAGFVAIEEKKPFESALPDIDKLDVHPRISLYLDALKPVAAK